MKAGGASSPARTRPWTRWDFPPKKGSFLLQLQVSALLWPPGQTNAHGAKVPTVPRCPLCRQVTANQEELGRCWGGRGGWRIDTASWRSTPCPAPGGEQLDSSPTGRSWWDMVLGKEHTMDGEMQREMFVQPRRGRRGLAAVCSSQMGRVQMRWSLTLLPEAW